VVWKRKFVEENRILFLDEVYMYSMKLLVKLYFRLKRDKAKRVYAAGDPNQLPPVGEEPSKELSSDSEGKERRITALRSLSRAR